MKISINFISILFLHENEFLNSNDLGTFGMPNYTKQAFPNFRTLPSADKQASDPKLFLG